MRLRFDTDTFNEIFSSLTRNKARTILTGFGVFWGVFMLLLLMGGGKGFMQMITRNFEGFASNTMLIVQNNTTKPYKGFESGRLPVSHISDTARLRSFFPEIDVISPTSSKFEEVVHGQYTYSAAVKGIFPIHKNIEALKIKYGRYLNDVDIQHERKVCVIGKRTYQNLFPEGGDPCGKMIRLGASYFQVVGVDVSESDITVNGPNSMSMWIPFPVFNRLFNRGTQVDIFCVTGKKGVVMSSLEPRVRSVWARLHKFDPTDKAALLVFNAEDIFNFMSSIMLGVTFILLLVGIGTTLAGAIGVSNIMIVTVKERTTEIGIRRAIGATPADILTQIMAESVTLTSLAGSLGIIFSVGVLTLLEKVVTDSPQFQVNFPLAVGAIFMIIVLGLLAGLAPALRAMKIKPVDAMRDE